MISREAQTGAEQNVTKLEKAKRTLFAGAASITTLALAACAPTGEVEKVEPTSVEFSVENEVKTVSIGAAEAILDILDTEGSGAVAYNGDSIGNKSAVIGEDMVWPSADDNLSPESFARFDTNTNLLNFVSVKGSFDGGGYLSTGNYITFRVGEDNSLQKVYEALDVDDFREALKDADTLTVESVEASIPSAIDTQIRGTFDRGEDGTLIASLKDAPRHDGNVIEGPIDEAEDAYKNAAQRILQITGAASENLEDSVPPKN